MPIVSAVVKAKMALKRLSTSKVKMESFIMLKEKADGLIIKPRWSHYAQKKNLRAPKQGR